MTGYPVAGYAEVAVRFAVSAVFVMSALGKIRNRAEFRAFVGSLRRLGVLPRGSAPSVAVLVVLVEAAIVLALWTPHPVATIGGYVLAAWASIAFSIGILLSRRTGARVQCRCFGVGGGTLGAGHVLRNAILTGLALAGALLATVAGPAGIVGSQPAASPSFSSNALAAACGLLAAAVLAFAGEVIALFRTDPASHPAPARDRFGGGRKTESANTEGRGIRW